MQTKKTLNTLNTLNIYTPTLGYIRATGVKGYVKGW